MAKQWAIKSYVVGDEFITKYHCPCGNIMLHYDQPETCIKCGSIVPPVSDMLWVTD